VPRVSPAVSDWAEATEAFDTVLERCIRQPVTGEGAGSACTRSARRDQRAAEDDLTAALEAAARADPACEDRVDDIASQIAAVRTAQDRVVARLDALSAREETNGPPLIRVERVARSEVAPAVEKARDAAESLDAGC
jgi:hypothetical protein